jgi:hypothetical protein
VENYLLHTDFTWGFRIKYPSDWRKVAISPTTIGFFSPPESPNDIFQDNVMVVVDETIVSLSEYVDFQVNKLTSVAPTVQIGRRSRVTAANLPAEQVEVSGQMGPCFRGNRPEMIPIRILTVCVMKGKRVYTVTYTAEARAYEKFMPQFRAMLESFELGGQSGSR